MIRGRRGFTLMEMVVVISMLSVMMLVIAATLWGAVKTERADAAQFHRITVQTQLADQFRGDVRGAMECVDTFRELSAGLACLILKMGPDRHLVYQWTGERLTRTEFAVEAQTISLPVGGDRISVEFVQSSSADRVVQLRLLESRGVGSSRRTWPVEIDAFVGGDRQ